ncbi:hypothetical protein A0256_20585 [Mucilaginibacter sp. PAMC 26640]|nr:hypothetical protein A0256_20585 [Mucilaginibacter sp. PAMC 26640]
MAHEAIIDASWQPTLLPIIQQKYPNLTAAEIRMAHSYAYGGAMVADMGYMPFGNAFFTDLLHYVRSGDFVENLIRDARTVNEYAFALGAISHYMADKYGHSRATNRNIPLIYPKLKKKFGDVVTYAEDHKSHSRMEFSYDVLQTGRGTYTNDGYHDFIGFNISVPVLEKAFYETYGQELGSIFGNINGSINTLRWGVRNLFPVLTKSAYKTNKDTILKMTPGMTAKKFQYKMSRRSFKLEYGKQVDKSKPGSHILAFLIKILPKVGPLKTLKYVSPGKAGEKLFSQSFDTIVRNYGIALQEVGSSSFNLPDIDFDTGNLSQFSEYSLADKTYDELLLRLQKQQYKNITPELKKSILSYYQHKDLADGDVRYRENWQKTNKALDNIKQLKPGPQQALVPLENPYGSTQ